MAEIIYDPEDEQIFQSHKWHVSDTGYAVWRGTVDGRRRTVRLHRLINNTPDGMYTDHKNGNKLDNRRSNLRTVTSSENARNIHGAKGYSWDSSKGRWIVRYGRQFYGRYRSEGEAKRAYQLAKSGVPYAKKTRKYRYLPQGVSKLRGDSNYHAKFVSKGKKHYLGTFTTVAEAAKALTITKAGVSQ